MIEVSTSWSKLSNIIETFDLMKNKTFDLMIDLWTSWKKTFDLMKFDLMIISPFIDICENVLVL
jgi:hypothetical protein